MTAQAQTKDFNLDALLDGTLDDLADLPEFKPFPVGSYRLGIKLEQDKEKKTVYFSKLKVLEVMELANSTDTPPEIGAESNVRYDLGNEYGQGDFKKLLSAMAANFGAKTNRELIEIGKEGFEALAITKQNVNKKNGQVYTQIVEVQVV